jgi:hypothetical protein
MLKNADQRKDCNPSLTSIRQGVLWSARSVTQMKKRTVSVYALALVVSAIVASTSVMSALPAWAVYTTYYSDNTYSVAVGERDIDCHGYHSGWGDRSAYSDGSADSCSGDLSCGFEQCVNNGTGEECGVNSCPW